METPKNNKHRLSVITKFVCVIKKKKANKDIENIKTIDHICLFRPKQYTAIRNITIYVSK